MATKPGSIKMKVFALLCITLVALVAFDAPGIVSGLIFLAFCVYDHLDNERQHREFREKFSQRAD